MKGQMSIFVGLGLDPVRKPNKRLIKIVVLIPLLEHALQTPP